jgi:hypothetical protein
VDARFTRTSSLFEAYANDLKREAEQVALS